MNNNIIINIILNCFNVNNNIEQLISWDSNNSLRLNLQLVCQSFNKIVKSFCTSLSLSKNNIIPLFYKIINNDFINIRHLEINVYNSPDIVTQVICNILQTNNINNNLKSIDLSISSLSNFHVRHILNALKNNSTVEDLNLEGNQLCDQSIYDLSCFLLNNKNIKYLDLQNCESKNGLACIGKLLSINNSILNLNWSNNNSHESIDYLCEGLKTNSTLTTLLLDGCNIDELGAISLGEVLKNNNTITCLDLSNNQLSDSGAISLALRLKNHPTIKYLDLSFNSISNCAVEKVNKILASNQTLKSFKIVQNNIHNMAMFSSSMEDEYFNYVNNSFDYFEIMDTSFNNNNNNNNNTSNNTYNNNFNNLYINYFIPRQMISL